MSWTRPAARSKQYGGANPGTPASAYPRADAPARPIITARRVEPKTPGRKSQSIRDSARGEECTVRIVGACNHDPATTVWSHIPSLDGGRGMGMKAIDEAGAYACAGCHDVVDGRRGLPPGASTTSIQLDWFRGHIRSLVRLKQKGLL